MNKICSKCEIEKDMEEFRWQIRSRGAGHSECKSCAIKYAEQYHQDKLDSMKITGNTEIHYRAGSERATNQPITDEVLKQRHIAEMNRVLRDDSLSSDQKVNIIKMMINIK